ncbi:MAG: alpha-mannosidase [Promethearchaeota archaeon]
MKEKLRIGKYSGNIRCDPKTFEEPDADTEFTKRMWLLDGEIQSDPDFQEEIKNRIENWKRAIQFTADPNKIKVHIVGESHIDCAWLWRYEQTREKAFKTFKKACIHADLFPDTYTFALSEPLLLEWIREDHPDLFEEIKKKVKSGNIELVGGSYVEPDCMMPSGEAFCRMRLYGMRFFKENFNILPEVEWFLDSFGYNWGIPQILKKSGAKYFWTSKLTWNYDTIFPFVNFWWESPDGSRILTANFGMGPGPLDNWIKWAIGRHPLKENGKKIWTYEDDYYELEDYVNEDEICPHVGNFTGKGDGGHGPTHEEVAVLNEYCKDPMFQWSKVHLFYKELEKWSDRFPVWRDELYLENHRGTFSVHARVKRWNRKNENALTSHESLALITSLLEKNYQYPFDTFEWLWKTTLKNQFHDTLPGSSIPEVYDDCWEDWMKQEKAFENIRREIGKSLTIEINTEKETSQEDFNSPKKTQLFLYNPVPWVRNSPVFIPITVFNDAGKIPLNSKGQPPSAVLSALNTSKKQEFFCQPVPAEHDEIEDALPAGWWTIPNLDSTGIAPFSLTLLNEDEENAFLEKETILNADDDHISNGIVSIKIDPNTGALLEIHDDHVNGGENLLKGKENGFIFAWQDEPKQWPAWNLEHYWNRELEVNNASDVKVKLVENGPVFATIEITKKILDNPITQSITLMKNRPEVFIDFVTNWKVEKKLLKILYQTRTNACYSVADIAYGTIARKTAPETLADKARFEKIMHKYVDLSTPDNKWGIALLNEGKYAFDTLVDNESIRLTLLKAAEYPQPSPESWVHKERAWNKKNRGHLPPKVSGIGPFRCKYALLPHSGGALVNEDKSPNENVKRRAEEFNQPVLLIPVDKEHAIPPPSKPFRILKISTPNVYLGALKLNEWEKDGNVIARFIEGNGISCTAKVEFNPEMACKIARIEATDILERNIEKYLEWDSEKGTLKFDITKFEIVTLKFVLKT